jgi:putative SOS response-associated peptidase YedK
MCGRFVQFSPTRAYADLFGILDVAIELPPRYNLAPSQPVLAARAGGQDRPELAVLRWGLVPHWSKGPDARYRMINARAETVHERPAYRAAFRYRRCLIPCEGFYEWRSEGGAKQPYFIRMNDARPFALAGLWEQWQDPSRDTLESCAIVVTEANWVLSPIHDRMPVILPTDHWERWLDRSNQDVGWLRSIMQPFPAEPMEAFPVSRRVNDANNEGEDLIRPKVDQGGPSKG